MLTFGYGKAQIERTKDQEGSFDIVRLLVLQTEQPAYQAGLRLSLVNIFKGFLEVVNLPEDAGNLKALNEGAQFSVGDVPFHYCNFCAFQVKDVIYRGPFAGVQLRPVSQHGLIVEVEPLCPLF